jgi:thiol-disulfide isomerase/thioredoxin
MNRILLILICTIGIGFTAAAQSGPTSQYTEKTIVKDSTGKVLEYSYWQPRMHSGDYSVNRTTTQKDTGDYILVWLSPEKKKYFAELSAQYRSQHPSPQNTAALNTQASVKKYVPTRLPRKSESFRNGEKFEPFKEKDIDGKKIDIKALEGKIVVINFWFIGCPACMVEIPELNEVAAEYANDPNVVFVGMCLNQRWEIKDFLKTKPFNFQHIANTRYYGDQYKVGLYPTTVVLDKQSIIKFNSVGSDNTGYWIKKTIEDIKSEN